MPLWPAPPAAPAPSSDAAPSVKTTPPAAEPLVRAVVPSSLRRKVTPSKEDELFAMLARTAHTHAAPAPPAAAPPLPAEICPAAGIKLIAIGASTGGTDAIADVLHRLQPPLPPIVIVQHIPPGFSELFARRLDRDCRLTAHTAREGEYLAPDHIYIAPGDRHVRVRRLGDRICLSVQEGPLVNGHCPSVDVLFQSVADQRLATDSLGVLLTGMGDDGARGLLAMRQGGARTLGQDEVTSVVYGMPRAAWEAGAVERQLPLPAVAAAIAALCARGPGAER